MKRDMKLVHLILDYMERENDERENDGETSIPFPTFDEYTKVQVDYHIMLCVEAGFLNKKGYTLTWAGHDTLEGFRHHS
jgi:hypothetical protein